MYAMRSRSGVSNALLSDCSSFVSTTSEVVARYVFGNSRLTTVATRTVAQNAIAKTPKRARRAEKNRLGFMVSLPARLEQTFPDLEQAFPDIDHIVRLHRIGEVRVEFLDCSVGHLAVDPDPA